MSLTEIEHLKLLLQAREQRISELEREVQLLRTELSLSQRHQDDHGVRQHLSEESWFDISPSLPPLPEKEAPPPPTSESPFVPTKRSRAHSLPPAPLEEIRAAPSSPHPPSVLSFSADAAEAQQQIVKKKKSRRGSDASTGSASSTSPRPTSSSSKKIKSPKSSKSSTPTPGSSPPSGSSFLALSPRSSSTPPKPGTLQQIAVEEKRPSSPILAFHHSHPAQSSSSPSLSTKESKRSSDRRKKVSISTPQDIERIKLVQTVARAYLARKSVQDKLDKKKQMLKFCLTEILTTERKYVESLNLLINNFKRPMENLPDLVTPQEITMIFSNIEELRDANFTFLQALEQAFSSSNLLHVSKSVANFFIAMAPDWRRYSLFCNNYWLAMNCLTACKERKAFSTWIKKAESIPEMGKLGLADWLIKGVKRVPQYVLLIKQVQKSLQKGSAERQLMRTAKILIKELAEWINDRKKAVENTEKLNQIQASLYGRFPSLRQTGRVFVKDTVVLEKKLPKGRFNQKKLYLFNDAFLLAFMDGKFDKMVYLASPDLSIVDPKQPNSPSGREKLVYSSSNSAVSGSLASSSTAIPPPAGLSSSGSGPDELIISVDNRSWSIIFASSDEMTQWKFEIRHLIDDLKWAEANSPTKEFEGGASSMSKETQKKKEPAMIESRVEKEGYLMKSSGSKPFRKRWFLLEHGYLFYFKSKPSEGKEIQTSKDMRHIDLNLYFVKENEKYSTKKRFCFQLHNAKQKTYYFATETKEDRASWLEAISPYTMFGKKKSSKDTLLTGMILNPQQDLLQFSSSGSERHRQQIQDAQQVEDNEQIIESDLDDDFANLTLDALTASRFDWQEDSDQSASRTMMSGSTASLPSVPPIQVDRITPRLDDSEEAAPLSPPLTREQIASAFGEPERRSSSGSKGARDGKSSSRASLSGGVIVLPASSNSADSTDANNEIHHQRNSSKDRGKPKTSGARKGSGSESSSRLSTHIPPVVMRPQNHTNESEAMPTILAPPRSRGHSLKRSLSLNEAEAGAIVAVYNDKKK